ncbi:hypothetical protein FGG08_004666 [Glutinoglossum americanum]|uniref:Uncharacterized protein n=1 Tax=Glutinoglossum americanum TaxID=1670608 RepID=A0A9P8I731_9PEZI|nr:hypothetical protein FGG08_004666 [Glutinoglossum americanum]
MDHDTEFNGDSFQWIQHDFDRAPIVHEGFIPQDDDNGEYEAEENGLSVASYSSSYADEPMDDNSGTDEDDYLHHNIPGPDNSTSEDYHSSSSDDSTSAGEVSDAADSESEFYTLQEDVANFQQRIRGEVAEQDGQRRGRRAGPHRRGKGGRRGGGKSAESRPEIKILQTEANEAFVDRDYDKAIGLLERLIKTNGEIYGAYTTLGEIHRERGNPQKSLTAFISAAHLKPNDAALWLKCASLALELSETDRAKYLSSAVYMFTNAISANPGDFKSMFQRASLYRELGHHGKAATAYEQMLKKLPHDTTVLRHLARVYIDLKQIRKAKQLYMESVAYYSSGGGMLEEDGFSWSDVNIYIELFGHSREYDDGIKELKFVARWMLGRAEEAYWDGVRNDDREWDSDDFPRRIRVGGFTPGSFPRISYGDGLPLELRIKLGLYRLKMDRIQVEEALRHFAWLKPDDDGPDAKVYDYPDLFREAAEALNEAGFYKDALRFYEPLINMDEYPDLEFYFQLADCYRSAGLSKEAEECYQTIVANDEENIDARVSLAKLYEDQNMPEQAYAYVNEIILLRRQDKGTPIKRTDPHGGADWPAPAKRASRIKRAGPPLVTREQRRENERIRDENVRALYKKFQYLHTRARAGEDQVLAEWMECSSDLIDDFRNSRVFYPYDKHIKFLGYSSAARKRALEGYRKRENILNAMEMMAERLQGSMEANGKQVENLPVPKDYRGISFDVWLDIFLEYALCLAKASDIDETYEIIQAAIDAIVFYHSRDSMFQIHVCWFTCALLFNDDDTICKITRWFMSTYQLTTDSYRLYAALHRLCRGSGSWYNAAPSQKYLLRQIRAMDQGLITKQVRHIASEKVTGATTGGQGMSTGGSSLNVALLVLYGHILYAGGGYGYALIYLFRAHKLDPQNPMISLSIGLSYIHLSLKRQTENRHFQIMQGFSFLFRYYDIRKGSQHPKERQEAEYNVGRAYHMLGLAHLGVPYYEKVLKLAEDIPKDAHTKETFTTDAAYNLQLIYAMAGNLELAQRITEKYLTL